METTITITRLRNCRCRLDNCLLLVPTLAVLGLSEADGIDVVAVVDAALDDDVDVVDDVMGLVDECEDDDLLLLLD